MTDSVPAKTRTSRAVATAIWTSVPVALKALDRLEDDIKAAPTFAVVDAATNTAAGLQRAFKPVKDVADRAGEVWIKGERRLAEELAKIPKAKGTRGQIRGSTDGSGGAILEPPEDDAPALADLGVAKKRAARARRIAELPDEKVEQYTAELKAEDKAITPDALLRKQREENKREKKHALVTAEFSEDGPFDCVVIDPPWKMEKIDRDVRPNQDAFDYPTMTSDEIATFWKKEISPRLNTDCHIFVWTTQKHLPTTIDMLNGIGLRYVLVMVWHKPGGFQPIGLPQYNCEFIVYARKGSPEFIDTKNFFTCFDAPRREHSRKPDEFYDTIRRVTGGSRIDIFSRERRDGFAQFGNQPNRFAGVE